MHLIGVFRMPLSCHRRPLAGDHPMHETPYTCHHDVRPRTNPAGLPMVVNVILERCRQKSQRYFFCILCFLFYFDFCFQHIPKFNSGHEARVQCLRRGQIGSPVPHGPHRCEMRPFAVHLPGMRYLCPQNRSLQQAVGENRVPRVRRLARVPGRAAVCRCGDEGQV